MRFGPVCSIAFALSFLCGCAPQSSEPAAGTTGGAASASGMFERALADATRGKKLVLVDFFTTWCVPCKKLERETWSDPAVRAWMEEHCVDLRVDAEQEPALAQRYRIGGYPTILLLKADGAEIDRLVGFRDAKTFLEELEGARNGSTSLSRSKDALAGHEKDPMTREHYADELTRAGRHEEALQEYLWCFDHGNESPAYGGVRLSFLLSDIGRLGKTYPPALAALETRRDQAEQRVRDTVIPPNSRDHDLLLRAGADVQEASALNRELGSPQRMIALYDEVRARGPMHAMQRHGFATILVAPLVEQRRYQDALDLFDEPEGYVKSQIAFVKTLKEPPGPSADETASYRNEFADRKALEAACQIYEALLGTQQHDRAAKVADQAIAYGPSWKPYVALIEAAVRAGAPDVARQVGERGMAVGAAEVTAVLRDTLERLPK